MKLIKFEKIDIKDKIDQYHHFVFGIKMYNNKFDQFYFVFTSFIRKFKYYIDPDDFSEKFGCGRNKYAIMLRKKILTFRKVFKPEN